MITVKSSIVFFVLGALFLLLAMIILGREGQVMFAAIGAVFVLGGLYARTQERRPPAK